MGGWVGRLPVVSVQASHAFDHLRPLPLPRPRLSSHRCPPPSLLFSHAPSLRWVEKGCEDQGHDYHPHPHRTLVLVFRCVGVKAETDQVPFELLLEGALRVSRFRPPSSSSPAT